jgi:hypothetical protein
MLGKLRLQLKSCVIGSDRDALGQMQSPRGMKHIL